MILIFKSVSVPVTGTRLPIISFLFHVLEFYSSKHLVQVAHLALPAGYPNSPFLRQKFLSEQVLVKRQNKVIPYNDCLYRNMYRWADRGLVLLTRDLKV